MLFRHLAPLLREGEGSASPAPAPAPTPAPAPEPASRQPSADPASHRRGDADWRAEVAAQRVRAEQAESAIAQKERDIEAARADAERRVQEATAQYQTREQQLQGKLIDTALGAAARAAGLVDTDLLPLMDRSGVKLDADGNVQGINEAIEAFKAKKPAFFASQTDNPAPAQQPQKTGSPANPPADPNPPLVDVKKMSKSDYDAWWKAEQRRLRSA